MTWSYAYHPGLWPALISAILLAFLGWYIWRRRNVPGAQPLAVAAMLGVLWAIGLVLESSATGASTKVIWFEFQGVWQLPLATAITCFVLRYAGLGRWLTRRNLILFSIPPFLVLVTILTNGLHHSMWQQFEVDQTVKAIRGSAYWVTFGYAYALALLSLIVFVRLFIRSPRHRRPVALMVVGQVVNRTFIVMDSIQLTLPGPMDPILLMFVLAFGMYAIALFRFRILDPVPLARVAVLEQMSEGMLVLDLDGHVVDLNPAALRILNRPAADVRGRPIAQVLPHAARLDKAATVRSEITLGEGSAARHYDLNPAPLADRTGELLGQLLLLHDTTEQKLAQAQVLEQQGVVSTLRERERLARELHDGIGQVLGYVGIQAQTARKWIQNGNTDKADSLLSRLVEVAKDAHADVRESILSLRTGQAQEASFISALRQYLDSFQANYGIKTEQSLPEKIDSGTFSHEAGVQLLRVIQEALTNARKHSGAQAIRVGVELVNGLAHITVADNGYGFDAGELDRSAGDHFGLIFMRERMEQIGGSMKVDSKPGAGTTVRLDVPISAKPENMK